MQYGYTRISTKQQSIDRQIRNIKAEFPDAVIVQESFTGTSFARPEWLKLVKVLRPGDTVIFDSVSRMSRDAQEGFTVYQDLYEAGIDLVFLKEPHCNTQAYKTALEATMPEIGSCGDNATDELVKAIMAAIERFTWAKVKSDIRTAFAQAEKEVTDLHKRTSEGLVTAKLNGKQVGRVKGQTVQTKKSKAAKEIIRKHSKNFGGTLSDAEVMQLAGCSRNSYYKYKAELAANG